MVEGDSALWPVPDSWRWSTLADIGRVASGGTPSTAQGGYFGGGIPWITPADLSGFRDKHIRHGSRSLSPSGLRASSAVLLPGGTVVFSSRAPIGYVAIAANPLSTNQGCKNLVLCPDMYGEYVYYYLKSSKSLAEKHASGTTFLEISAAKFAALPIPIPPLPEQRRIVARLEELFTQLDAGVEALQKAKVQLKRYRQSVLKAAFEGKLTAEWREKHKGELEPASVLLERICVGYAPDTDNMQEHLPSGWSLARMGQVASINRSDPIIRELPGDTMVTFVPMAAVDADKGTIVDSVERPLSEVRRGFTQFRDGDVLFAKITPCMQNGKAAIARGLRNGLGFGSTEFHVLRPSEGICAGWLFHYMRRLEYRRAAVASFTGTAGQLRVPAQFVQHSVMPIPPTEEQIRALEEIDRRFSIADDIEASINGALERGRQLRRSILKAAFEGKLVPQDPADEPAEKLLERIRAERQASAETARRSGARAARKPTQGRLL